MNKTDDCDKRKELKMVTGSVQEKNGKFYAVINYKDEYGKRKLKWINTGYTVRGNKKKAKEFLENKLAEWNKNDVRYCNLTVADYFQNWLKEVEFDVKPNTYRNYKGNMTNHIIPYFKAKKILLQELKPYHLEDYYRLKLQPNSKCSCTEKKQATENKRQAASTTLFRNKEAKGQRTIIVETCITGYGIILIYLFFIIRRIPFHSEE